MADHTHEMDGTETKVPASHLTLMVHSTDRQSQEKGENQWLKSELIRTIEKRENIKITSNIANINLHYFLSMR